jgi:phosphoenolpyruvate carboxylase
MSTQHPDNVTPPFFAESSEMSGNDEIEEAFYAYSHLGCDEQMWDYEGKEVDGFVVKKLLTKFRTFFDNKRLGKDLFLTLRVPNPEFEKAEAKILVETLESIPRSFDASNIIYNDDIPPIFEIILPMVQSDQSLDRIYYYYHKFVFGKQNYKTMEEDITIGEWVGKFAPKRINVIPLFEDKEHMLYSHHIVHAYLTDKDLEYQRVFYARSDPALNYGLLSAVLINKIAHQKLYELSEKISVDMHPIIGVGSAPFRGNLKPETVDQVVKEYPSVQTFSIQSAFKYDNPPEKVHQAVKKLNEIPTKKPHLMDELRCYDIIDKYSQRYSDDVLKIAPMVNKISKYMPKRRKRKLHIGLFGYCRSVGEFCLPRAIGFTAALYSLGFPPELLGLNCLNQKEYDFITTQYVNFEIDLKSALKYYNPDQKYIEIKVVDKLKDFNIDFEIDEEHKEITTRINESLKKESSGDLSQDILMAANIRKFLG